LRQMPENERKKHLAAGGASPAFIPDSSMFRLSSAQMRKARNDRKRNAPPARRAVPGDLAALVTPSLAADLRAAEKAAKVERETEGQELITQDHGEGKTPGGGSGRGLF